MPVINPISTVGVILHVEGGVLLQRRTADATTYASKWNMFGGGIERGEDPLEAAVREIEEELGLLLKADDLELIGTMRMSVAAPLLHYYSAPLTVPLQQLRLGEGSGFALLQLEDLILLDLTPEASLALERFYETQGFGWIDRS